LKGDADEIEKMNESRVIGHSWVCREMRLAYFVYKKIGYEE